MMFSAISARSAVALYSRVLSLANDELSLRLRARRRPPRLQILVVPRQVPLEPIALIARPRDAVVLVRIDHELRVDAEAAQRLIHLLSALHGDVEIALAAQEQRRRLDPIRVEERVRDLLIRLPRL